MADRAYVAENEVERKRLASLVARLSDQDLARPMPGGWTVASVLGHVAFWDQRIIALDRDVAEGRRGHTAQGPRREPSRLGQRRDEAAAARRARPGAPRS